MKKNTGRKEHIIFNNYDNDSNYTKELAIDALLERENENLAEGEKEKTREDLTDEEIQDEVSDEEQLNFDDEKSNLSCMLDTNILVVASLGLWNGTFMGYRELGNNLNEVLSASFSDCDYAKIYVDGHGQLRSIGAHHDGNNSYLFRAWKKNVSDMARENLLDKIYRGKATMKEINSKTISLGKKVKEIYGF